MFALLFECPACHQSLTDRESLPLCGHCHRSLVTAPALCSSCAGLECQPNLCSRPWISQPGIDSFSARFVCVEPGYRVLKLWKTTQAATALDARILSTTPRLATHWQCQNIQVVTWIPQHRERSWKLGGSPAERIARWVARECRIPALGLLLPSSASGPRQAELRIQERLAHRLDFRWDEEASPIIGKNVMLVDDFMTTGRTFRVAAQILRGRGVLGVHVFCLGIRPPLRGVLRELQAGIEIKPDFRNSECASHLDHRAGRTVTVG